jgi:hypothetical protein
MKVKEGIRKGKAAEVSKHRREKILGMVSGGRGKQMRVGEYLL